MKNLIHIAIVAGIICGILIPQIEPLRNTIPYLIIFILAFNFFDIDLKLANLLRWELLLTGSLSAVVIPLIYFLFLSRGLSADYRVGILLTAIAPSGVMPLVLGRFVPEIDYDLVLSNFLFTTFGAVVYLPFMVKWLAAATVSVPVFQLLYKTALMILLPYGISRVLKAVCSDSRADGLRRWAKPSVPVLLFVICALVASGARLQLEWNIRLLHVMILVFSVYLVQGGIGYVIGGLFWEKPVRRTLALISSSRNNQISLGLAIISFSPATAIPCIFGFIFHHVTNAIWLWLFRE